MKRVLVRNISQKERGQTMSSSHDHHMKQQMAEAAAGTVAELAKQGGLMQTQLRQNIYQAATHHGAGQAGAYVGRAVASAAPYVVAGTAVVAPIAVPVAVVGGVAYIGYRFVKWLCD